MSKLKSIFCPTCHNEHDWENSKPWSPFCCKRCKLIDLGDWASEKHKIAGEKVNPQQLEELEQQ
ncbi:MAG: DNA gyrase inhibitor YacG [Pseudomonadota bacterium]